MKSWMIIPFLVLPVFAQSQSKVPLSTKVEELLNKRKAKEAREAAGIEKIRKDAIYEKLQRDQKKKQDEINAKKKEEVLVKRFIPKTPFLNFRPATEKILWKASLHFSLDSFESTEASIKKEYKQSHFFAVNEIQYSWTKKLLFKYHNTYNFSHTTKNKKREVSGATITPDPDITNSKFGDHVFEANFRKDREIFYGYDLDYFFKVVYPFGDASRGHAYSSSGGESDTSATTASQKGNLKSPFGAKPVFGVDYFSGKKRDRYNFGGLIGYAMKGRYTVYKGTGYWSSSPGGLIVKTGSFADTKIWFNYQKRPDLFKKTYYGFGLNLHYLLQQEETFLTQGADGFSWDQKNKITDHYRLSGKTWVKYQYKKNEHFEASLSLHLPYKYEIKKRIIDEGPDGGGNRVFSTIHKTEKIKRRGPIELRATYVRSF